MRRYHLSCPTTRKTTMQALQMAHTSIMSKRRRVLDINSLTLNLKTS
jgi:hypothetical protein